MSENTGTTNFCPHVAAGEPPCAACRGDGVHETPEEKAISAAAAEYIRKVNAFASGENHTCPLCSTEVTGVRLYEKFEPEVFSLYALPCNCRLGLWSKAPDWITRVEFVSLDDADDFAAIC